MADDLLRRRERELAAAPGDRMASARLVAARVRAGELPARLRALGALEQVARGLRGRSARAAALAQVAWGRLGAGEPGPAALLAAEVGDLPPGEAAQQDLWIEGLARAGAVLVRAGRGALGRALLARAGTALHAEDPSGPWGDLVRPHERLLRAALDARLEAGELPRLLPELQRSLRALAAGCVAGIAPDPALLAGTGLRVPLVDVLAALERTGYCAWPDLTQHAHLTAARLALDALTPDQAREWVAALERWVAQGPAALAEEFDPTRHLSPAALARAGLEPGPALLGWADRLERAGRREDALVLRLTALELGAEHAAWPAPAGEALLEAALRLGSEPGAPGRARARVLVRLVPHLRGDERLLRRVLTATAELSPLARADVLQALARVVAPQDLRAIADRAAELLEQPSPPAWAVCDALAGTAEAAWRAGHGPPDGSPLVGVVVEHVRRTLAREGPAFQYGAARALLRIAVGGAGRSPDALRWRREALDALTELVGQDLEDAACDAARTLGACPDPAWREDGLAALAEALAAARAPGLTDRHLLPPLGAVVEGLLASGAQAPGAEGP